MIEELTATILPALLTVISALATWGLAELTRYIRTKTKSQAVADAMDRIGEITLNTVAEIEKSIRQAGADGKIDADEAKHLKTLAIERVKAQLPVAVKAAARGGVNSLDDYLAGKVEEMVTITKQMNAPP